MTEQADGKISRRGFLRMGVAGSALLAAGAGAFAIFRRDDVPADVRERLRVVKPHLFPVLVAVAEAVLPPDADPVENAFSVDERLSYVNDALINDVNLGLTMLENGFVGLFTRGSARAFTSMSLAERQAGLHRWRDSWIWLLAMAYDGIRKLCLGAYYATEQGGQRAGYPGPPFVVPDPGPRSAREPLGPPVVVAGDVENPVRQVNAPVEGSGGE